MNITLSVSGELEHIVKENKRIKWTEIAREAIRQEAEKLKKLELLQKYLDKKPINREEWQWMEKADWHPVDELEYKKEFVENILKASKGKTKKVKNPNDLFK